MTHPDPGTRIQRVDNLPAAPVGDSLIMMSVEHGEYFSLNDVGTRLWELLERPTSVPDLLEQLCAEYDVDDASCAAEVMPFLAALRARGLIVDVV